MANRFDRAWIQSTWGLWCEVWNSKSWPQVCGEHPEWKCWESVCWQKLLHCGSSVNSAQCGAVGVNEHNSWNCGCDNNSLTNAAWQFTSQLAELANDGQLRLTPPLPPSSSRCQNLCCLSTFPLLPPDLDGLRGAIGDEHLGRRRQLAPVWSR